MGTREFEGVCQYKVSLDGYDSENVRWRGSNRASCEEHKDCQRGSRG